MVQNYSKKHDLKAIYDKIIKIVEIFFKKELNEQGNFKFYPTPPKMSDKQVITLSICSESLGIDSKNYFLSKFKTDYSDYFPSSHITRYNKRRKTLASKTSLLAQRIGNKMSFGENFFIVDSIPVSVCKISREQRTKVYVKRITKQLVIKATLL